MTVSRTRDVLGLTAFVVLCFGVSVLGGRATLPALAEWYPALRKPPCGRLEQDAIWNADFADVMHDGGGHHFIGFDFWQAGSEDSNFT